MGMLAEHRIFVDRRDAGFEVGKLLEERYKGKNALVVGIPRGGVVIAYEIANLLEAELSAIITKKLPHPQQKEFAIGSIAEDGSVYLTSAAREVSSETIRAIVRSQEREIQSRIQRFRKGKPLPDLQGRIVIIADDGIATGSTIVPAITLCKRRKAAKVIIAAPVSGKRFVSEIHDLADEIVIVEQPEDFYAVGQVYNDFHHLSDEEVVAFIDDFERKQNDKMKSETIHNSNLQINKNQIMAIQANEAVAKDSKLKEFFVDQLQDILWAEKKLVKTLPKLQEAATTTELKDAFSKHLEQTRTHVDRLYEVFNMIGEDADTQKCPAMAGIVDEGEEIIDETEEGTSQRDVGLIFAAQKAEHYEIATYGGLVTLAHTIGYDDAAQVLSQTLAEEKETDVLLTQIAERNVNYQASLEPK